MQDEQEGLSRREFGIAAAAVGVAAATGAEAAAAVAERAVEIRTPDGVCDAVLVHATARKEAAAVIVYPDIVGLRPTMVGIARRLAGDGGYAVLVVNQFYRSKRAPVAPPNFSFDDQAARAELFKLAGPLTHETVTRDAAAFVDFLDAQPEVDRARRIGAVGFCMGGAMTIRAAAIRPGRVGACASFHGGALATDDANSPHRLIARTRAAYHIGIAADDDAKDPQAKVKLAEALTAAKLPHTMEVYPGTRHGWTVPDSAVYDRPQAERAWAALTALYKRALT